MVTLPIKKNDTKLIVTLFICDSQNRMFPAGAFPVLLS